MSEAREKLHAERRPAVRIKMIAKRNFMIYLCSGKDGEDPSSRLKII
jgi:hypothetical protein